MAGIGFVLRKLVRKDDLLGVISAHVHSALVSTGPWLFTILAIAGVTIYGAAMYEFDAFVNFHSILIYNFAFSLIFASPFAMVATRYLADRIYERNVTSTPGLLVGMMALMFLCELPIVAWFYFYYTELTIGMRLIAFANFYIVSAIWLLSVFLTALKDYWAVTRAFAFGTLVAFLLGALFKTGYGQEGMLLGFSIGLALIVFLMIGEIMAEYNYQLKDSFKFTKNFRIYWNVVLGATFYSAAIWIDKIVMAFAPEAQMLENNMLIYFDYTQAMFLAYIVIIPSMAIFMLSVETNFFLHYHRYFKDIMDHVPLAKIKKNHKGIIDSILEGARSITVVQGVICFICITLAHRVFDSLGVPYTQLSMFRIGVLGAFFHVMTLFGLIILSYFDERKMTMWIQLLFVVSNGLFTYLTIDMGIAYYGYGYFASALLTFFVLAIVLFRYIQRVTYHTFITNNTSIIRKRIEASERA